MGQKVNPIANRLGFIRGWDSVWNGEKKYAEYLLEDEKIRKYINARVPNAGISKIVIERSPKLITITIHTARPGLIIGKGGQEVDKLKEEIKKFLEKEEKRRAQIDLSKNRSKKEEKKDVQINIFEIRRAELEAILVANNIARQIEGRIAYKKAIKTAIASTMRMGAKGIKVQVSGRLNGAEMARSETYKEGRIPLHTFRADIDYALSEALTKLGLIGVKVWIFRDEVFGKRDLSPNFKSKTPKGGRRYKRK